MLREKNIFIFVIIVLFLFIGVSDVKAKDRRFNGMKDSDMTCVFDKFLFDYNYSSGYLLITSKKGGKLEAYFNTNSGELDDKNWVPLDKSPVSDLYGAVESDVLDSDGYFKSCPKYFYKYDLSPLTAPFPDNIIYYYPIPRTVHYVNQNPNDYLWYELRDSKYVGLKEEKYEYFPDINSSVEISLTSPSTSTVTKTDLQSGRGSLNSPTPDGYKSCLYARCSSDDSCESIIQMDYSETDMSFYTKTNYDDSSLVVFPEFEIDDLNKQWNGSCPVNLFVHYFYKYNKLNVNINDNPLRIGPFAVPFTNYTSYSLMASGKTDSSGVFTSLDARPQTPIVTNELIVITSCEDLLTETLKGYLSTFLKIIKIMVPLILIGLGILDFAVAIFSGKEDDMKKHANKFVKRLIIAIVIFFIPSLLQLLLTIASNIWNNIDPSLCGILD